MPLILISLGIWMLAGNTAGGIVALSSAGLMLIIRAIQHANE